MFKKNKSGCFFRSLLKIDYSTCYKNESMSVIFSNVTLHAAQHISNRNTVTQSTKVKGMFSAMSVQAITLNPFTQKLHFYRPQRSCEGYVFTGVYLSTGRVCLSACWDTLPGADTSRPADGYCCGRYASYWNTFLFILCTDFPTNLLFL